MNREKLLKKHLSLGFFYKIFGMSISYISIPLFLNYLGEKDYGLWMTIFSTVSWIYMFDMGIGNGLKNKLTKALTEEKYIESREYISTGYITVIIISTVLLLIGNMIISQLNIKEILNLHQYNEDYIKKIFYIIFNLTVINFIVKLYQVLYMAKHNNTITNLIEVLFQSLFLILLYLFNKFNILDLTTICILYPGINILLGIIFTIKYFLENRMLIPNFKYFKKSKIGSIGGIGLEFFIIQISMLIILTTDNIIITKLIGVEAVTPYTLVLKFFQVFLVISTIILTPLWTLFLDAYIKKDKEWILKIIKKLNILFLLLIVAVIISIQLGPYVIKIWTKEEIIFPKYLFMFSGIFILLRIYGDIYMYFLNSIGKIKLQMYLYILGAIMNIPLSIIFVKKFNLDSSGVILATNICIFSLTIVMPIEVSKVLKKF